MTTKDFKLIAELLSACKPLVEGELSTAKRDQWKQVVRAFDTGLAVTNPRFNSIRFNLACEYGGDQ